MVAILVALVVLGTAVWVDQDARKLQRAGATKRQLGNSPLTWGIATILVWVIVFPWYLTRRGKIRQELGVIPIARAAPAPAVRNLSSGTLPQTGWYVDPTNALQQRLWDGSAWTDQVRVSPPVSDNGPL